MLFLLPSAMAGGTAFFNKDAWTVDEKVTIEFHYVVGPEGLSVGDQVRLLDPRFHGVRWSQWGKPLLDASGCTPKTGDEDPSNSVITASAPASGTISLTRTVSATGGGATEDAETVVEVEAGSFAPGDEIIVIFGDTAQGADCGQELPERTFHHVGFEVTEDIGGSGPRTMPNPPTFDIVAEDTLANLYVQAPSRVVAGTPFQLRVVPMDRHGNAIEQWTGTVTVSSDYAVGAHTFTPADGGVTTFGLSIEDTSKVHRIDVTADDGTKGRSNPIQVSTSVAEGVYWGDIHVHGGHDYEVDGVVVDENIHYARDIIGLDVSGESMKADPVCLDSATLWAHLQDQCVTQSVDGSFISLLGFEWMGNLLGNNNGHHNFYLDVCELDRPEHFDAAQFPDGIDGFGTAYGPYEWAADAGAEGARAVIVPHAPEYTGYNWGKTAQNDDFRRQAEVYSEWGFNMEPASSAGSIPDGLNSGNHMGFIAASDNHVGWMGNPLSYKNVNSGLTAFLAPSLTRKDVFGALYDRHTYATTGARIILDVTIEDGVQVPTGTRYVAAAPTLSWSVSGTDKIAEVKVVTLAVTEDSPAVDACVDAPGKLDASGTCVIDWDGATETAVWVQVTQNDGEIAWASPIWLDTCGHPGVADLADRCQGETGETADTGDTDETGTVDTNDEESDPSDTGAPGDTGREGRRCGCESGQSGMLLPLILPLLLRRRRQPAARRGWPARSVGGGTSG